MTTNPTHKLKVVDDSKPRLQRRWKSDAERQHLPLATTTDGKGAPPLDVRAVLERASVERLLGRKVDNDE